MPAHENLFEKACKIYDTEGFEKARGFLIQETKKPYPNPVATPPPQPKRSFETMQKPEKLPITDLRSGNVDNFLTSSNFVPESGLTQIIPQQLLDLMNRSALSNNDSRGAVLFSQYSDNN